MEVNRVILQSCSGQLRVITSFVLVTRDGGGILHWNDVSFNEMKSIIVSICWPFFLPRGCLSEAAIYTLVAVDDFAPSSSWEEVISGVHLNGC